MANTKKSKGFVVKEATINVNTDIDDESKGEEVNVNADIDDEGKKKTRMSDVVNIISAQYMPFYIDNKVWFVTSDNSVFLSPDEGHAVRHQHSLNKRSGNNDELLTIKTE
ncbi:MAG: hypothetical protein RRZ64_07975 [Rikenellaceae bacterium]